MRSLGASGGCGAVRKPFTASAAGLLGLAMAALLGHPRPAAAQTFATGLVPAEPAAYAKLPSVKRHRGFYKPAVDLSDRFPAPGRQGNEGSCVAWATAYAARSMLLTNVIGHPPSGAAETPSPQYVYSRLNGEAANCNTGVGMVDALNLLRDEGVVSTADAPYGYPACRHMPAPGLRTKAGEWRISGWRSVQRRTPDDWRSPIVLDDLKSLLSVGRPVVVAIQVTPGFMAIKAGQGVYRQAPQPGLWHAVALVGYDEARQAVKIMNSWGPEWADGGFVWIDYATFEHLAGEAYVLDPPQAEALRPPAPPPPPPVADPEPRIAAVLRGVDCADLRLGHDGDRRVVTGYGGLSPDLIRARTALAAIDPALEWRVATHPWPQCEAELTLAQAASGEGVRLRLRDAADHALEAAQATLRKDDLFSVEVETRAAQPFVQVFYIQADGSAVELYRGAPTPDAEGRRRVTLGADGAKGVRFAVDAPFGDESLIAVASDRPLLTGEAELRATEREFLTRLRARLIEAQARRQPLASTLLRLKTVERG